MKKRSLIDRISPLWLGFGISGFFLIILLVSESVLGRWAEILAGGEFNALADVKSGVLRDVRVLEKGVGVGQVPDWCAPCNSPVVA